MACTDECLPIGTRSFNYTRITRTIFVLHGPIRCYGTRRIYEPKCAFSSLLGRARSRVRDSFSYLAHVNVLESQLGPPVVIVSALLIGRSAAFPTVSLCLCERDLIYSFWQPIFQHVAFMHAVLP